MLIIATFEHSIFIELALTELEQKGITKEKILAVPLDKRSEPRQLFDTIHRADGFSMLDGAAVFGTCFMLLGTIYGYVLAWGPIIWGIIGAVTGLLLGFLIKYIMMKKTRSGSRKITSEIVLLLRCEDYQLEMVQTILWNHMALGVSALKR
ncbi:MAG: hypothetical protein ACE3JP_15890 [Ectobacillus sp.]